MLLHWLYGACIGTGGALWAYSLYRLRVPGRGETSAFSLGFCIVLLSAVIFIPLSYNVFLELGWSGALSGLSAGMVGMGYAGWMSFNYLFSHSVVGSN